MVRLEHANLQVRDLDATIRFLQTAFPDFRVRGEGPTLQGARWVHVGRDDVYLALKPQASRYRELMLFAIAIDGVTVDELHHQVRGAVFGRTAIEQTRDVRMAE